MTNDAKVTEKHIEAAPVLPRHTEDAKRWLFGDAVISLWANWQGPITMGNLAQALANAGRDGRKEGLEEAAKWFEAESEKLILTAERRDAASVLVGSKAIRLAATRCMTYAKAIRALHGKPAEDKT